MQYNSIKNCIATLQSIRDTHYSQLDASVLLELDEVIAELTKLSNIKQSDIKLGSLSNKALQVISLVINIITNINDLMK
jgi:hypothetical protein